MPRSIKATNMLFFTRWSRFYDYGPLKWWLSSMQKHAVREVLKSAEDNHSFSLLDIGCGTGDLLQLLAQRFKKSRLYGIDITPAMLSIAEKKLKQYKNVHLKQADAGRLPFKDNTFDFIATTEAFHHIPEPDKVLLEMRRVLKYTGRIILIDVNFGPVISHIFHVLEPGNVDVYSKKEFKNLFEKAGLGLLEQKRIGIFAIFNLLKKQ